MSNSVHTIVNQFRMYVEKIKRIGIEIVKLWGFDVKGSNGGVTLWGGRIQGWSGSRPLDLPSSIGCTRVPGKLHHKGRRRIVHHNAFEDCIPKGPFLERRNSIYIRLNVPFYGVFQGIASQ
jgi:hypothetical protein